MKKIITTEDWKKITLHAIGKMNDCFKPREIQTLIDFVETVIEEDLN